MRSKVKIKYFHYESESEYMTMYTFLEQNYFNKTTETIWIANLEI